MRSRNTVVIAAATVGAFVIDAPLLYHIWMREWLYVVAAFHLFDPPPSTERWFTFFFWAAFSIPVTWLIAFVLAAIELTRKKRGIILATWIGAPFAFAATYFIAWETFVMLLARKA